MGRDQDGNAARVEHLGLGRVLPADASTAGIADAVRDALADPALGHNACRHAPSLAAEITADRAVTEMEALTRPLAPAKGSIGNAPDVARDLHRRRSG
jgi:UDP:flavonoid glycosyltransferase YjiC (YdhE family)